MGGKPNNAPPPHTHGKNGMAPTWREKTAHIEKIPPTKGETPPLPHGFFYSCSTPWRAPTSPLAGADHDLHSLYSVCLRELEKKSTKIQQKQKFSGSFI